MGKTRSAHLVSARLTGTFWSEKQKMFAEKVLLMQWQILNGEIEIEGFGRSHCIDNFRICAGEMEKGNFGSYWFSDHELGKWMEAAAYSLELYPSEQVRARMEETIALLKKAQAPDGYLNTYYTLYEPGKRFTNFTTGHELLNCGNFLEAGIAYYRATGERELLEIAKRNVVLIESLVNEADPPIYDGHEELEIALIRLYELEGEDRWLRLAAKLIDTRGVGKCRFATEDSVKLDIGLEYYQAHKPVREQSEAEGHAVRAVYLYTAMEELGRIHEDKALLEATDRLWEDIVQRKMYLTGGIGSEHFGERFTPAYDLPGAFAYAETCASIGLMMFARARLRSHPDVMAADVMEKALYNTVLAGISKDGERYFYVNPLSFRPEVAAMRRDMLQTQQEREEWMACPCCPPNLLRLILSLGDYVYTQDNDGVYLQMWVSNRAEFERGGVRRTLTVRGNEPWDGRFTVTAETDMDGAVFLKRPYWAQSVTVLRGGSPVEEPEQNGYLRIDGMRAGECIEVQLPMVPRFVFGHPFVEDTAGKTAVERGYVVYCAEQADNGARLSALTVDGRVLPQDEWSDSFADAPTVKLSGSRKQPSAHLYGFDKPSETPQSIRLIPYALWNNRGVGEMAVWLPLQSV